MADKKTGRGNSKKSILRCAESKVHCNVGRPELWVMLPTD